MTSMSKTEQTKLAILKELSHEQFVSGQYLAAKLNLSRAAISKQIKSLSDLGLDIYSVTGKGYKLAQPLTLLSSSKIVDDSKISVEVHPVIDSTNDYIKRQLREGIILAEGHTVVAECQTDGKGRRGKVWVSPFGSHLYMTRYCQSADGLAAASGLSLAVGIAVLEAIGTFVDAEVKLKWPNDVLINNKKIAGVLVEAEGQSDGLCHLIIGIGINVAMPELSGQAIDQPWSDLNSYANGAIDRNELAKALIEKLDAVIAEYKESQLTELYETWNKHNAYKSKLIKLQSANTTKTGICLGVDTTGALLVEDLNTHKIQKFHGGEISLRNAS